MTSSLNINTTTLKTNQKDPSILELFKLTFAPRKLAERIPMQGGLLHPFTVNLALRLLAFTPFAIYGAMHGDNFVGALMHVAFWIATITFAITGWLHVCCKLTGGNGSYEATFRCFAYTAPANFTMYIPFLSVMLTGGLTSAHLVESLQRAHCLTKNKTLLAIVLAFIVPSLLYVLKLALFG